MKNVSYSTEKNHMEFLANPVLKKSNASMLVNSVGHFSHAGSDRGDTK